MNMLRWMNAIIALAKIRLSYVVFFQMQEQQKVPVQMMLRVIRVLLNQQSKIAYSFFWVNFVKKIYVRKINVEWKYSEYDFIIGKDRRQKKSWTQYYLQGNGKRMASFGDSLYLQLLQQD